MTETEIRAMGRQAARNGLTSRDDPFMPTREQMLSRRVDIRSRWWVQAFQDEMKTIRQEQD
jgi:hypothetical protein